MAWVARATRTAGGEDARRSTPASGRGTVTVTRARRRDGTARATRSTWPVASWSCPLSTFGCPGRSNWWCGAPTSPPTARWVVRRQLGIHARSAAAPRRGRRRAVGSGRDTARVPGAECRVPGRPAQRPSAAFGLERSAQRSDDGEDPRSGQAMVFDHPRPAPGTPGAVTLRLTSIQDRNGRHIDIEWSEDDSPAATVAHHGGYRVAVDRHPDPAPNNRPTACWTPTVRGPTPHSPALRVRRGWPPDGGLRLLQRAAAGLAYDATTASPRWTDRTGTEYTGTSTTRPRTGDAPPPARTASCPAPSPTTTQPAPPATPTRSATPRHTSSNADGYRHGPHDRPAGQRQRSRSGARTTGCSSLSPIR